MSSTLPLKVQDLADRLVLKWPSVPANVEGPSPDGLLEPSVKYGGWNILVRPRQGGQDRYLVVQRAGDFYEIVDTYDDFDELTAEILWNNIWGTRRPKKKK